MFKKNKKIILVFFIFLIILSIMQFTVPQIIGYDGYLHIKTADIIKNKGFIKEFPWTEHTILSENYADIQILFRILLIPFTFLGLNIGGKIAAILFGAICFTVFYWFLLENKIKFAFFWTVLYLFSAESLMYRFLLLRQMPIVITLLILTIYFLQKRKYFLLSLTSFVYILLYSGFIFQLFIILTYLILEGIFSKKFDHKALLYSLTGTFVGLIINPYFPDNIPMLYTQIFKVNLLANLYNVEWRAWSFFDFIKNNIMVFIYFTLTLILLIKNRKISRNKLFYLFLGLFFFIFTIKSRRMQEYLIPFSILMSSLFFNDYIGKLDKIKFSKYIKTIALIFIVILALGNFSLLRRDVLNNNFLYNFDNCINWMDKNIPENSLIFINAYAFTYLFFKNSDLKYSHGIDLTYSYLYDAEEFERYMGILRDTFKNKEDSILKDYNPDYLFVGKIKQDLKLYEYIIEHRENYNSAYEDDWCAVLEVKS